MSGGIYVYPIQVLLETIIFRCHVSFRECDSPYSFKSFKVIYLGTSPPRQQAWGLQCSLGKSCHGSGGRRGAGAAVTVRVRNGCLGYRWKLTWVEVSNIFYLHPYLGKIPILTNMFSKGLKPPTSNILLMEEVRLTSWQLIRCMAQWQITATNILCDPEFSSHDIFPNQHHNTQNESKPKITRNWFELQGNLNYCVQTLSTPLGWSQKASLRVHKKIRRVQQYQSPVFDTCRIERMDSLRSIASSALEKSLKHTELTCFCCSVYADRNLQGMTWWKQGRLEELALLGGTFGLYTFQLGLCISNARRETCGLNRRRNFYDSRGDLRVAVSMYFNKRWLMMLMIGFLPLRSPCGIVLILPNLDHSFEGVWFTKLIFLKSGTIYTSV